MSVLRFSTVKERKFMVFIREEDSFPRWGANDDILPPPVFA